MRVIWYAIICMDFYYGLYKRNLVWLSPPVAFFAARRQRHDIDLFEHVLLSSYCQ